MVNRDLSFFETLSGVKIVHGNRDQSFSRYAYDSRRIEGGELFLAFATEKNDGNRYIEEALRKGASGYVGQRRSRGFVRRRPPDRRRYLELSSRRCP